MPENDLDLVRTGLLIENHFGWEDYDDLSTSTTPFLMSDAGTWYDVPNDAAGPQTNNKHKVIRRKDTYNPDTGSFDFSSLKVGDMVFLRLSLYFENSTSNDEVQCRLSSAIGSGYDYTIPLGTTFLKNADKHHVGLTTLVYIGNEITRSYPTKLQVMSDTPNVNLFVDGWVVAVFTRD